MPKTSKKAEDTEAKISEVMGLLGKRSAEARKNAWGKREFKKRMQEWGKLGGRPRKAKRDLTESEKILERVKRGSEKILSLEEVKAKYRAGKPSKTKGRKQ